MVFSGKRRHGEFDFGLRYFGYATPQMIFFSRISSLIRIWERGGGEGVRKHIIIK